MGKTTIINVKIDCFDVAVFLDQVVVGVQPVITTIQSNGSGNILLTGTQIQVYLHTHAVCYNNQHEARNRSHVVFHSRYNVFHNCYILSFHCSLYLCIFTGSVTDSRLFSFYYCPLLKGKGGRLWFNIC